MCFEIAIGDRQCYDLMQRRSRRLIDDHLRALIEIHESSINKTTQPSEHQSIVNRTLQKLPAQERDVLMLRYHLDLSLQDIATTQGIGLSAAKMRLYRALEKFTELLPNEQHRQIAPHGLCA